EQLLEIFELAEAAANRDRTVLERRHSRRVVAAVLEAFQALHENEARVAIAHVSDDAAHQRFPRRTLVARAGRGDDRCTVLAAPLFLIAPSGFFARALAILAGGF